MGDQTSLTVRKFIFSIFLSVHFFSQADDFDGLENSWLVQFARSEFTSAELVYHQISEADFYRTDKTEITFDFKTLKYRRKQTVRLEQKWDVLTAGNSQNPKQVNPFFSVSRVEPWTNENGVGVYLETLDKELDNWLVFKSLSKILVAYSDQEFSPAFNGFLLDDELKCARKMAKSKEGKTAKIWNQFSYDSKGFVSGLNQDYLKSKLKESSEVEIIIKNSKRESIRLKPMSADFPLIKEAVRISKGNSELTLFSEELNFMLHKFAADFFPDPSQTKLSFLRMMHEQSKKGLHRFEEIANNE